MKPGIIPITLLIAAYFFISCEREPIEAGFKDMKRMSIYHYIVENKDDYSAFLQILERGGVDKTLSAFNPNDNGYTLFLPDNDAIIKYIEHSPRYNSLDELLGDDEFVTTFSRYHIVNRSIHSSEFPFGSLPAQTLSNDFLAVSFVFGSDTAYYNINNQAPVKRTNIELSNGIIHLIANVLDPITYTTYEWLSLQTGFSVFKAAVELTGFDRIMNVNTGEGTGNYQPFTLLLEHDSVYRKRGINSIDELILRVSPDNEDYKNPSNPLYNFVGYHMLTGHFFLSDFVDIATNYTTYSEVALNINGLRSDIRINPGKQVFDTIVRDQDTTIIDFIMFEYDHSNIITQSGVIHFIDQVMFTQAPSRATQTFHFYEEPIIRNLRNELGIHLIEDTEALQVISISGADLEFVQLGTGETNAWNLDYLQMTGDFRISYKTPRIVQGRYRVIFRAERFNPDNAMVSVSIDGKNIGGIIDLSSGGTASNPFQSIQLGVIDFTRYEGHTITVSSMIPGRFLWDAVRFEPI
jgi:uncharacterized surface protein with fasciclin (FAS1) repeats